MLLENITIDAEKRVLFTAIRAAQKSGDAILGIYGSNFEVEYKDDKSPLTLADRKSHEIILRCLEECDFPVLSEEGRDIPYEERSGWKYFWLVDPLDGTKEFIKKNGEFAVNIALIFRDSPIIGVVYLPAKEMFYFGAKGLGAYKLNNISLLQNTNNTGGGLDIILRNSYRLPVHQSNKSKITVIGSRSHATPELNAFVEMIQTKYTKVDIISAGSAFKFCLVAEGNADVYPRFSPTMEWDTAAGQCIVEQSGGRVLSITDKTPLLYNKKNLKNASFICNREDECWINT